MNEKRTISAEEALQLLEETKKQYAEYLEISKICDIAKLAKSVSKRESAPASSGPTRNILGDEYNHIPFPFTRQKRRLL